MVVATERVTEEVALPATRHQRLIDVMREKGHVTVAEVAALFNVSRDTIRRDLQLLEHRGLLTRTHGGALAGEGLVARETRFQSRMNVQADVKQRIGRAAAALIREGETLLLNGGSTTCCFAAELGTLRDLTIVTNNLMLPSLLDPHSVRSVYVLGGRYWENAQVTTGEVKFSGTARISVDTAVIGVSGIDATGISISRLEEANATTEMIGSARRTVVIADSSKFGVDAFAHVADFRRIQFLVTDVLPPFDIASGLVEAGVQVVICPSVEPSGRGPT